MRTTLRSSLGALTFLALAVSSTARADRTFNVGSLIIPTGAAFQTRCGSVATYGLVYDVLRANAWLEANDYGRIEIFYAYNQLKKSPNRCKPTNISVPDNTAKPATDPIWNDGCDFQVYNNAETPVRLVNNLNTADSADTDIVTFDLSNSPDTAPDYKAVTIRNSTGSNNVHTVGYLGGPFIIDEEDAPTFLALLQGTLIAKDSDGLNVDFTPFRTNAKCDGTTGNPRFDDAVGGYVRIHRSMTVFDAPAPIEFNTLPPRIALLATPGGSTTTNSLNLISTTMTLERTRGATMRGTTITLDVTKNLNPVVGDEIRVAGVSESRYNGDYVITKVIDADTFEVVSTTQKDLPDSGRGSVTYASAWKVGTKAYYRTAAAHGFSVGTAVSISGVDPASYNFASVAVAGVESTMVFWVETGSSTAEVFSISGGTVMPASAGITGKTGGVSNGILQDYLSNAGLDGFANAKGCPTGGFNVTSTTRCPRGDKPGQIYDEFDINDVANNRLDQTKNGGRIYKMFWAPHWSTTASSTTEPTAFEKTAIDNLSAFLNGQAGLMAECHSIEALEGSYKSGTAGQKAHTTYAVGTRGGQLQTCVNDGTGKCKADLATNRTPWALDKNSSNAPAGSTYLMNCSDPGIGSGTNCAHYSNPGDPFVQPGDFLWFTQGGSVSSYLPLSTTSSMYRPGVTPLVSGVKSFNATTYASSPRSLVTTDYATRSYKDNDVKKSNIMYVGGHDVSGVVSGTKTILQTLLLLGEPPVDPVMREVTRSSPIASYIDSKAMDVLVQGSFEKWTPPLTTPRLNTDGDGTAWRFPHLRGHMRAVEAPAIQNGTATTLDTLVEVFDAADRLPSTANSYTGCGAARYGAGAGGCRTIFTHLATGLRPANVVLDSSAASNTTLKTTININGGTINADFPVFLQRLIAGQKDAAGNFVARLGGVDRSTVAIVPPSLVAGSPTRPKVVYFGAADGMLHAVCASVQTGTGCDLLGRELWAFVPRLQLPFLRRNVAKVDGSPRVMDLYGDFTGTGTKAFRTILMVSTGNGDPATSGMMPSVTALDITNPFAPTVVWDYALANATSRAAFEAGQGLSLSVGPARINGSTKNLVFVHTNNGGTGGVGNVLTAIDAETGAQVWRHAYSFPVTPLVGRAGGAPGATGIPGGATFIDKTGSGFVTDVVFGTLYGDVWQLDATTGISRHGTTTPLFRHTADKHPFGTTPTIYSSGSQLYAIVASGGYADLAAKTLWSASDQAAYALWLSTRATSAPLTEGSGTPELAWTVAFGADEKAFGQAVVIGDKVFFTTDSIDVNASGSTGYGYRDETTGHLYGVAVDDGGVTDTVVLQGGAGSVTMTGGSIYNVSKDKAQKLSVAFDPNSGEAPSSPFSPKLERKMWLRSL